jgi:hypothetical protein
MESNVIDPQSVLDGKRTAVADILINSLSIATSLTNQLPVNTQPFPHLLIKPVHNIENFRNEDTKFHKFPKKKVDIRLYSDDQSEYSDEQNNEETMIAQNSIKSLISSSNSEFHRFRKSIEVSRQQSNLLGNKRPTSHQILQSACQSQIRYPTHENFLNIVGSGKPGSTCSLGVSPTVEAKTFVTNDLLCSASNIMSPDLSVKFGVNISHEEEFAPQSISNVFESPNGKISINLHESQYNPSVKSIKDVLNPTDDNTSNFQVGNLNVFYPFASQNNNNKNIQQLRQSFDYVPWVPRGSLVPIEHDRSNHLLGWKEKLETLKNVPHNPAKIMMAIKSQDAIKSAFEDFIKANNSAIGKS